MGRNCHYSGLSFPGRKKDHIGGSHGYIGGWRNLGGGLRRGGCCQVTRDTMVIQCPEHRSICGPGPGQPCMHVSYHPKFMGERVSTPKVPAKKSRAGDRGPSFKAAPLTCPGWLWPQSSVQFSLREGLESKGSGRCPPRASHLVSPGLHQSAHLAGLF